MFANFPYEAKKRVILFYKSMNQCIVLLVTG